MEKISCGGFLLGENLTQSMDENGMPVLNAEGGGDSDEFVIKFTQANDETWTCDKTIAEYNQAYSQNKPFKALIHYKTFGENVWVEGIIINVLYNCIVCNFIRDIYNPGGTEVWTEIYLHRLTLNQDGLFFEECIAYTLPEFTEDDEDKVLKIVDGQPAWVAE